jgi:diguanylate cyclase (GGDEF)-like protein
MVGRRWCMRFDRETEAAFQASTSASRLQHFLVSGAFSVVNYNAFLLVDLLLIPDVMAMAVLLRLCLFTPLCALTLWMAWRHADFVRTLPNWMVEGTVVFHGGIAAVSMAMLLGLSESPLSYAYHAGFAAVLIYGNVVQRVRFVHAVPFSLFVLGLHAWVLWHAPAFPAPVRVPMLAFVCSVGFYTLLTNRRLERDERARYLSVQRAQDLREQLRQSHARLEEASRTDALTGLANRLGLERHMKGLTQQSWLQGRGLVMLVVDVDHFKAFNDRHGHPAGDETLRLVAQCLRDGVPGDEALACRWGGEEFVLVRPGLDADQGLAWARELVASVRALAIRHDAAPDRGCVTISVGVACWRGEALESLEELMARADAALYLAKRRGRHRAELAPEVTVSASMTAEPRLFVASR